MTTVWIKLYIGEDDPEPKVFGIYDFSGNIDQVKTKVQEEAKKRFNVDIYNLAAFEAGTFVPVHEGATALRLSTSPPTNTTEDDPIIVIAGKHPRQPPPQHIKTNILGDGVLETLRGAVFYVIDTNRKPIGTGFFVSPTLAVSAAHTFPDSMKVGTKRTGYFGKPNSGKTCRLVVDIIDKANDFVIFEIEAGTEEATKYLDPAPVSLDAGDEVILVAYQIGIHEELKELGKVPSIGVFPAAVAKAHDRHFAYIAPSFAGDSGGAIIFRGGQAAGMHIMTVNQALELKRLGSLDEHAATGEVAAHVDSVEQSVNSIIESLSSGALAISVSAIMAAHASKDSKRKNM